MLQERSERCSHKEEKARFDLLDPNDRVIMMFVCTCPIVFKFNPQPVVPIS